MVANATTRLATLPVVTANTINIRLDTQAVTLPDGFRDVNADGDNAVLRVNQGVDTNGNGHIDYTTPGSVVYGFEEFAAANKSPGYGSATGNGWYQQAIDATNLPEGYNFITVRAFRHGDGRAGGVHRLQAGGVSRPLAAAGGGRELRPVCHRTPRIRTIAI